MIRPPKDIWCPLFGSLPNIAAPMDPELSNECLDIIRDARRILCISEAFRSGCPSLRRCAKLNSFASEQFLLARSFLRLRLTDYFDAPRTHEDFYIDIVQTHEFLAIAAICEAFCMLVYTKVHGASAHSWRAMRSLELCYSCLHGATKIKHSTKMSRAAKALRESSLARKNHYQEMAEQIWNNDPHKSKRAVARIIADTLNNEIRKLSGLIENQIKHGDPVLHKIMHPEPHVLDTIRRLIVKPPPEHLRS